MVHPELEHLPQNMKVPLMSINDSQRKLKETYDACAQRILTNKKGSVPRSTSAPPSRQHQQLKGQKVTAERKSQPVWSSRGVFGTRKRCSVPSEKKSVSES